MEIVYRAFDGETFTTPEECLKHEKENPLFVMFDNEGNLVHSPEDCYLLQIINQSEGAAAFIELNEKLDYGYSGIDIFQGAGWYWWDGGEYCWLDPTMIKALIKSGCVDKHS